MVYLCSALDDPLVRGDHLKDLVMPLDTIVQMRYLVKMRSPSHGGLDILVARIVVTKLSLA